MTLLWLLVAATACAQAPSLDGLANAFARLTSQQEIEIRLLEERIRTTDDVALREQLDHALESYRTADAARAETTATLWNLVQLVEVKQKLGSPSPAALHQETLPAWLTGFPILATVTSLRSQVRECERILQVLEQAASAWQKALVIPPDEKEAMLSDLVRKKARLRQLRTVMLALRKAEGDAKLLLEADTLLREAFAGKQHVGKE